MLCMKFCVLSLTQPESFPSLHSKLELCVFDVWRESEYSFSLYEVLCCLQGTVNLTQ